MENRKYRIFNKVRKQMLYSNEAPRLSDFFMAYELAVELFGEDIVFMDSVDLTENCNEDVSLNKEIYVGDIIEFFDGSRLVVEWNDDKCKFQFSDGSDINDGERYATHKQIVGNIYTNS